MLVDCRVISSSQLPWPALGPCRSAAAGDRSIRRRSGGGGTHMRMGNANTSAGTGAGEPPSSSSSPSSDSNPCTPSSLHYNGLHPYSKQFVQAHRAGAPSDDRDVGWKGTSAGPAGGTDTSGRWKEEEEENEGGVPVFVMLPLDTVRMVEDKESETPRWALSASLAALKSCGVQGVMVDVWWGLVEKEAPGAYDWLAYSKLFHLVRCCGLTIQAVMSFHQCGSNVGDSCCIPLPDWVVGEIDKNPGIVYTDRSGNRNYEYISLGCDTLPVLQGRTPVQVYADFMTSFRDYFRELLGEHGIVEIQVGMGPAGELRYPSYPEGTDQWRYPGIGEFQCFDKYMLASLKEQAASTAAGSEAESWGVPPTGTGGYNHLPEATPFFRADNGGWTTPRGRFFLTWYADMLLSHGDRLLSAAAAVFRATGAHISGKVSGIHWHYGTDSHAAELTAGYYNTPSAAPGGRDGYLPLAQLFARHGARLTFTCMEMTDREQAQPAGGSSRPEALVAQVAAAVAATPGARLAGENALARLDRAGLEQIVKQARRLRRRRRSAGAGDGNGGGHGPRVPPDDKQQLLLESFTYLRLCHHLFVPHNWTVFVAFVKSMRVARPSPTNSGDDDDDDDTARIHHP